MFARFCGLGPGHKSTHHEMKVFQDEIKEVFGLGHGKAVEDGMGDTIPPSQPTRDEDLEDGSELAPVARNFVNNVSAMPIEPVCIIPITFLQ